MTAGRCARTVRTGVFAAIRVTLAALGHVVMSGAGVPWWALLVALIMTGVVGWGLSASERAGRTVVTAHVGIQVALHAMLCLAQAAARPDVGGSLPRRWLAYLLCTAPPTPHPQNGSMPSMPGMSSSASTALHAMPGMGAPGQGMSAASSAGMLAAHVLAAALCGGRPARGERVAFDALRAVESWLAAPLRLPQPCALLVPDCCVPASRPVSDRAPRRLLLARAITQNLDCADVAATTARLLLRGDDAQRPLIAAQLDACLIACRDAHELCGRHAGHREHCRVCSETARTAAEACEALLTALKH